MVSLELQRMVEQMLSTPGSTEYEAAKTILNDCSTLWDAIEATGLTDDMTRVQKAETYWVFATMPDEVSDRILDRTRAALDKSIPVRVSWTEGDWAVAVAAESNDGLLLDIYTPIPDLSKLQPGAFAGAMA